MWDPAEIDSWVLGLRDRGVPYCVFADRELVVLKPVTVYSANGRRTVYTYAETSKSSVRATAHRSEPFQYTAVDPAALTPESTVAVVPADSARLNFLKDHYLSKGIAHVPGEMNFLVYLDGSLAGGFIYAREKFGGSGLYLLSDFAISRQRKLSKLIAFLATCGTPVSMFERRYLIRVSALATTAFTNKPVSMKYRGIFRLVSRKPGMLNYESATRREDPQELYRLWYRKWAEDAGRK